MKITAIVVMAALALFLYASFSFASWGKKPEFRWQQLYRSDPRHDNHELYINRVSLTFSCLNTGQKTLFKSMPFFEIRRNIGKELWQRNELGIELGKDITEGIYIGESIQKGWMKEDFRHYGSYEKRDYLESETRFLLSRNLFSGRCLKINGFILDEYTYDFDRGAAVRNEVAMGLVVPIGRYIEAAINWRHIDRIHFYDSDTFEGSLTAVF